VHFILQFAEEEVHLKVDNPYVANEMMNASSETNSGFLVKSIFPLLYANTKVCKKLAHQLVICIY